MFGWALSSSSFLLSCVCCHGKGSSEGEKDEEAEEAYDYVPSGGVSPYQANGGRTQVNVSSVVDLDLALRGPLPQSSVPSKERAAQALMMNDVGLVFPFMSLALCIFPPPVDATCLWSLPCPRSRGVSYHVLP